MPANGIGQVLAGAPKTFLQPKMWALYDQAVISGSNFFVMLLLARALSLEAFGLVSLAYSLKLFLDNHQRAFFTQPMNVIGANESPPQQARRVGALLAMHVLWIPMALLFVGVAGYFFYPYPALIAAVCFYLAASQLQEFFRRVWYTEGASAKAFVNDAVSHLGQCGSLILLHRAGLLSAETAFFAMGANALLAACLNRTQGLRLHGTSMEEAKTVAAEHWHYGRWLVLGVFVIWGATQLYPFMLAKSSLAAVAALGACRSLLNGLSIFMQAMNSYLPSHARRLLSQAGEDAFGRYFLRLAGKLALVAGGFCVLVYLFAPQLLLLVYGPKYLESESIMRILTVATFVLAITAVPTNALISLGRTRDIFIGNLVSTIFTLVFGWNLVQTGGAEGAATGILIAVVLSLLVQTIGLVRVLSHGGR